MDNDPVFAEITIRRLERFRKTGQTGWQYRSPFPEVDIPLETATTAEETRDSALPRPKTLFDEFASERSTIEEPMWKS
jgi:hypothetical protein